MAYRARSLAAALCVAGLAPLPIVAAPSLVFAQNQPADAQDEAVKQIPLTEAQIQGYLAAQAEMEPILAKQQSQSQAPSPKTMAQLDAIAKKHQFASYDDYDLVDQNIGLVVDGVDPQSKTYVGADVVLKKQITEIQANKAMPAADKKQALAEMSEALKSVQPVKIPANIDLVVKYYEKLIAATGQPD
jgi:hypothetical protein